MFVNRHLYLLVLIVLNCYMLPCYDGEIKLYIKLSQIIDIFPWHATTIQKFGDRDAETL